MGRSLCLTPKFIYFSECYSSGTWNKEYVVFSEAFGFQVAVLVIGEFTAQTARGPGVAVVEDC